MVQTQNLAFSYPNLELRFPDLSCGNGQTLLITGGSGKGKTTLLHLLGGLLRPTSGSINIGGTDIAALSEKKLDHFRGQNVGIILQEAHFIESLSVLENVVLAIWLANGKRDPETAKSLLVQLGLEPQLHKLPSQLSVGQQQRVSIARAVVNKPQLILADEPTSSLDDENAANVAHLLSALSVESGAALVIVTHDGRLKSRFPKTISL
jgi:putative ABC transport system ATP-binding protein